MQNPTPQPGSQPPAPPSNQPPAEPPLAGMAGAVHTAIWLIGLAILFSQGWFWPGILVLAAISGLAEAAMRYWTSRAEPQAPRLAAGLDWLPAICPRCGGPLGAGQVKVLGARSAECSYCGARLTPSAGS